MPVTPVPLPQLAALEALRGRPALLYYATLNDETVDVLYQCLRRLGPTERLDLVLCTTGGFVTTTRRIALLLREYARQLTILVPYRARSAGTLLCLSADELVLTPLSELSPLDPCISAVDGPPNAQGMISAADIRAFRDMSEDWFGVTREEDRLQVLALIAQRFFPTSLSTFYRSDRLIREVARELLRYQLPGQDAEAQRIADQLAGGYHSHDYGITRSEARALGLRVHHASAREEVLLWELWQACRQQMAAYPGQEPQELVGLIATITFQAREVHRWITPQGAQGGPVSLTGWEIDQ